MDMALGLLNERGHAVIQLNGERDEFRVCKTYNAP